MPFQFYCPQGHLLEGHESQMGQQSQCPMCGAVFVVPMMQQQAPAGWTPGYGQPGMAPGYPGPMPGAMGYQGAPGYQPMPGYQGPSPGYPGGQGYAPGAAFPGMEYQGQPSPGFAPASEPTGFAGVQTGPAMQTAPAAESSFPGVSTGPTIEIPQFNTEPSQTEKPTAAGNAEAAPPAEPEKKEPRIVRIPCPQGHELQTPMEMIGQDVLCPFCSTQFHLKYEDSIEFKQEQAELQRRREEHLNRTALKWAIIAAVVVVLGILTMIIYLAATAPSETTPSTPPANTQTVEEEPAQPADENSATEDEVP
jgi:hypothetical protein